MRKLVVLVCLFFIFCFAQLKAQNVIVKGGSYDDFEIYNGRLWAWGYNSYAALGDGTTIDHHSPVAVGSSIDWTDIFPGDIHTVGKKANGSLWVWGSNNGGELGQGFADANLRVKEPMQLGTDLDWLTAAAGIHHTLAIKNDGSLWSWGYNLYGELGYSTYTTQNTNTYLPVRIESDLWKSASGGYYFSLGIKADGKLWAWGDNRMGQLGQNGDFNSKDHPVQIGTDNNWMLVTAGYYSGFAIKNDGSLWAWGDNRMGQLGIGNTSVSISVPQRVGTDNNWASVSSAREHTLAVKTNGTLWSWGSNADGQLGIGTTSYIYQFSPIQVGNESNWSTNISANGSASYAKKNDNTVWSWGGNEYGQLGLGNTTKQYTPQEVLLPQNAPLPVTLLNFNVSNRGNENLLQWTTGTELNVSHFELEKSNDGIHYKKMGTVKAVGNSNANNYYQFSDLGILSGKSFYRLKIIDRDASYTYSKVVVTNMLAKGIIMKLFPNPAQYQIHVHLTNITNAAIIKVQIIDASGRIIKKENLKVANNEISTNISLIGVQKGIYFINIPERNIIMRFIKE